MPRRVASCWSTPTIPVGPSYVLASRPRASCRSGSSDVAVTGIGRLCGTSASRAPRVTTVVTPRRSAVSSTSEQNRRHRMDGSMPWTSATTSPEPGRVAEDGRRVIAWPSTSDTAERLGVTTVVTLGALLADVPHSRPIPVTATSDDPELQDALGLDASTYEGPTGIVGVLQHEATRRGMRGLSVWAAVPHYVAHPPSPKATVALLVRLEELLGEAIPLGDLPEDAEAWQHGVDELAVEDSEIAEYIAQLEEAKDTVELPEATGEAIAREFERYLRRRDHGTGPTT